MSDATDDGVRTAARADARRLLGLGVRDGAPPPSLAEVMRSSGAGWYVLVALGVLGLADTLGAYAFGVLGPEISRALGISRSQLAGFNALRMIAVAAATVPIVLLVQRRPRRALVAIVAAFAWAGFALLAAFTTSPAGLVVVLVGGGITAAAHGTLHTPLLVDSYAPEGRVRVISTYTGLASAGNVLAPLGLAVTTAWLGFTWRGVFLVLAAVALLAACASVRLRDPGVGRLDTQALRRRAGSPATPTADLTLGFTETVRRILLIPTIRRMLAGWTLLGVMSVPFATFFTFLLDERWGLGPGGRGLFAAFQAACALASLAAFGRRGEQLLRADPARVVRTAALFIVVSITTISLAVLSPWFWLLAVLVIAGQAGLAVLTPALGALQMAILPAESRPHAVAVAGMATGFGGLTGSIYLSGIDRRFGVVGAIVALAVPGVIAALIVRSAARLVERDIDRMIDDVVEDARITAERDRGHRPPLLAVRSVDAGYGDLQVLFGIDLVVHEGEMVALLGTNGSGKSTLLKVVSGLLLPTRGSVRLDGREITYLAPERRARLGMVQVPGGHAVFPPLTVVENLRAYAASLDLRARERDALVERVLERGNRLAERRNQPAGTLSGGEQQLLALAKAELTRPRLLMIDELSLGLSPVVVGELLERLRAINADGTAVVLVEQSVNVALSVCDRAMFLEKGQVRFSGAGSDLLGRDDLLRAVFLGGAAGRAGAPGGGTS